MPLMVFGEAEMHNFQIYVCCHQPAILPDSRFLIPIQAGRAVSLQPLDMLGDDSGMNISALNKHYCELTALYWIWRNCRPDYFGLFHYRRFLNFAGTETTFSDMDNAEDRFGLHLENIRPLFDVYDVILPQQRAANAQKESLYELYAKAHVIADLDLVLKLLGRYYPAMKNTAEEVLHYRPGGYYKNMMIASYSFWDGYCSWLFDLLFRAAAVINPWLPLRDAYQQRVYGFLSERLLNVYVEHVRRTAGLRIKEVPILEFRPEMENRLSEAGNF